MASNTRDLLFRFLGDDSELRRMLDRASKSVETTGQRIQRAGGELENTLTPAARKLEGAFRQLDQQWGDGLDAIRTGTGATGAELDRLGQSMRNVGDQAYIGLDRVGQIMADVATRTGATGAELEALTLQMANLERVGNSASVETVTRVFGDWSIATADQADALDQLFRASQATGPSVDRLGQLLVAYGAPLREFGFGVDEAAALLGQMEQAGVNTELVMGGLRQALARFAREGRDPAVALGETIEAIENAGSAAEANTIAFELFGRRAGVDMARAIQEGRFSYEDLVETIASSSDTINGAADDIAGVDEKLQQWKNRIAGVVGPVSEVGFAIAGITAAAGPAVTGMGKVWDGIQRVRQASTSMGDVVEGARGKLLSLNTVRLVGVTAAVGVLVSRLADARAEADAFATGLDQAAGDTLIDRLQALREVEAELARAATRGLDVDLGFGRLTGSDEQKEAFDRLDAVRRQIALLEIEMEVGRRTAGEYGDDLTAVADAAGTVEHDLTAVIPSVRAAAAASADAAAAVDAQTRAADMAAGAQDGWARRTIAATQATDTWRQALAGAGIDTEQFGQGVATSLEFAARELETSVGRMDTALRSFGGPVDAFEAALDDGGASLAEWVGEMDKAADDQVAFADNMARLATRVSDETFAAFLEMADRNPREAARMAAEAVAATDEELAELDATVGRHTDAAIAALADRAPAMNAVAQRFGDNAVNTLEGALARGVLSVSQIAHAYSEGLRQNVNPILIALEGQSIPAQAAILDVPVGVLRNSGGPIPGSGPDRDSVLLAGTPGEWVIRRSSAQMYGPAAMEAINDGTAEIYFRNAGGPVGYQSVDAVPGVPSVMPARGMVGDPATTAMGRMREAVVEWLRENQAPQLGPGIGWQAMWDAVAQAMAMGQLPSSLQFWSGFRPGAVTRGSGAVSWHARGRAIDVGGPASSMAALMEWIIDHYLPQTIEGLYTPFESRQVLHGRHSNTRNAATRADHYNHVHWAMANGAVVRRTPGGIMANIGEGPSDEAVIPLDRPLPVVVVGAPQTRAGSQTEDPYPWLDELGIVGPLPVEDIPSAPTTAPAGPPHLSRLPWTEEDQAAADLAAEIAANMETLRIEGLTAQERLVEVTQAMADLEAQGLEYSAAWMELLREQQGLQEDINRETEQRLSQARGELATAHRDLTAALQQEAQIRERMAAAEEAYGDQVARLRAQSLAAEKAMVDRRRGQLAAFDAGAALTTTPGGLTEDVRLRTMDPNAEAALGAVWRDGGANVASLRDRLAGGNADLAEFSQLLLELRGRGLSEDVIQLLGLDEQPSEELLDWLRALAADTDAGLAEINQLVVDRFRLAGNQVAIEQQMLVGDLGAALIDLQTQLADSLTAAEEQFRATSEALAGDLATVEASVVSLTARVEELTEALAALANTPAPSLAGASHPVLAGAPNYGQQPVTVEIVDRSGLTGAWSAWRGRGAWRPGV